MPLCVRWSHANVAAMKFRILLLGVLLPVVAHAQLEEQLADHRQLPGSGIRTVKASGKGIWINVCAEVSVISI